MIYLNADEANQTVLMTLKEMRQTLTSEYTDYLFVLTFEDNGEGAASLAQVAEVNYENDRITSLTITTENLTASGRYRYEVYGQNSASNIDPTNASVVGLVERGYCLTTGSTTFYEEPTIVIPAVS